MNKTISIVTTEHASRYLQQLCKHWSHRFAVNFDPRHGTIEFSDDQSVELTATDQHLEIHISDKTGAPLHELEHVVAEHLMRFAFKEQLEFDWVSAN